MRDMSPGACAANVGPTKPPAIIVSLIWGGGAPGHGLPTVAFFVGMPQVAGIANGPLPGGLPPPVPAVAIVPAVPLPLPPLIVVPPVPPAALMVPPVGALLRPAPPAVVPAPPPVVPAPVIGAEPPTIDCAPAPPI